MSFTSDIQMFDDHEGTSWAQVADNNSHDVNYLGPQSGDNGNGDDGPLQCASFIPGLSILKKRRPSTGHVVVFGRQRAATKREKQRHLCALLGEKCPFMPTRGFGTCSRVKEDSIRHMNAYQCMECGKRFGKKYGLTRHGKENRCKTRSFIPVSPELAALVVMVEEASGYKNIEAIMTQFKLHFVVDWDQIHEHQGQARKNKENKTTRREQEKDVQHLNASKPSLLSFQQHRGAQASSGDIHGQEESRVCVMDRGHLDVDNGGHLDIISSPNNSDGLADAHHDIYNCTNGQGVVGTQEDSCPPASGSCVMNSSFTHWNFDSNQNYPPPQVLPPTASMIWSPNCEDVATNGTSTITQPRAQSHNFSERQNTGYDGQYNTSNPFTYRAVGSTTEPIYLLPGCYDCQQDVRASEISVGHFGDPAGNADLPDAIDPIFLEQAFGPGPDNSNGSSQITTPALFTGLMDMGDIRRAEEWDTAYPYR
ncbi:hypothetical protein EV426DRAFT_706611 [Tirmania nivea]|nr:hypothetical protein EV426DRAFT_706611 [Tirmania nivea]